MSNASSYYRKLIEAVLRLSEADDRIKAQKAHQ